MDGNKVKRDIRLLKESLQREYQDIAWTWRLGFQKRNAPHVHFLTDMLAPLEKSHSERANNGGSGFGGYRYMSNLVQIPSF